MFPKNKDSPNAQASKKENSDNSKKEKENMSTRELTLSVNAIHKKLYGNEKDGFLYQLEGRTTALEKTLKELKDSLNKGLEDLNKKLEVHSEDIRYLKKNLPEASNKVDTKMKGLVDFNTEHSLNIRKFQEDYKITVDKQLKVLDQAVKKNEEEQAKLMSEAKDNLKKLKTDIRKLELNDGNNSSENGSVSSASSTESHLCSEISEVAFNTRFQNRILVRFDQNFHRNKTLSKRVTEAFKTLAPGANPKKYHAMLEKISKFSNSTTNQTALLLVRPSSREELINFLRSNRSKETGFRFTSFIHHQTRLKKRVLGTISKKMCEAKPKSACVPRFSLRAYLIVEEADGKRNWLTYSEVVKNPLYLDHITEAERDEFREICQDSKILLF